MLTNHGIKFFDLHFLRLGALVFGSGIEVTSTGARNEANLVTHGSSSLDFLTLGTQVANDLVDAQFVDDTHSFTGLT